MCVRSCGPEWISTDSCSPWTQTNAPKELLMDDEPCHLFTPLSAFLYFHFSIWLSFLTFLSLCASSSSISAVFSHLITVALVNKCITHELIHGSFSSAPYGPTAKPQQLFKVFANMCFLSWSRQSVTQGLLHFSSNNCTDKTPQELEKCRSADTFKRDREELNTREGLTTPHTTNQLWLIHFRALQAYFLPKLCTFLRFWPTVEANLWSIIHAAAASLIPVAWPLILSRSVC